MSDYFKIICVCQVLSANALRLETDQQIYGTSFVDVTGKRIDPQDVTPFHGASHLATPDSAGGSDPGGVSR